MEEKKKTNYRISLVEFSSMLFFAIFFDILSVIPGIGVLGQVLLGAYFYVNGVKVLSFKGGKFAISAISSLVEAIPMASIFPTVMVFVCVHTFISRAEDKIGSMTAPTPNKNS